jgi:hypothetical protein
MLYLGNAMFLAIKANALTRLEGSMLRILSIVYLFSSFDRLDLNQKVKVQDCTQCKNTGARNSASKKLV